MSLAWTAVREKGSAGILASVNRFNRLPVAASMLSRAFGSNLITWGRDFPQFQSHMVPPEPMVANSPYLV